MAIDAGSAVGYLDLDISGFLDGLKTAQDEADKASKNFAIKFGSGLSGFGSGMSSFGSTLTKNVTVPIAGIGVVGIKTAAQFEKGMSGVQAITGATEKDLKDLKDTALDLGATTSFSASEVAAAMTEMAKAGWTSQQIIEGMSGVLDAAAASGEGLGVVSTIVADAITGFGLEAKDSSKVADLLTQAANSGTIGVDDLGESFKYIAPVASSMGLSIDDVTTALSAMSMSGIKGSQAGTSLRTVLTRMVKPTDAVASAMDELGISLTNSDGTFKSLDTIISEMRGTFGGLTDEEKTYYAATLAGQEGMSGLLSLLNMTQSEYDEIAASMDNASGVAKQTADVMQNNLSSKVEQLGGSLETLAIKVSDLIIPYLQKFVVWLTNLVDKFAALDPETKKTILKFAGIAAVAGPVIGILGKVTTTVGGLFTAFGKLSSGFKAVSAGGQAGAGILSKLGGAFAGITAPIVAVIAVIGTLAAAFVSLWQNNEEFRNKITEIWNEVKETFDRLCQGIVEILNSLGFDFENIGEVLKTIWEGFCNFLAPIFTGAFQIISDVFSVVVDTLLGVLNFFISIFKGDWEGAWNAIKGVFEGVWNGIVNIFQTIWDTLLGILDTVCGWFGTTWDEVWTSIKTFFVDIWNSIVDFFTGLWEGIVNAVKGAWDLIMGVLSTVGGWIYNNVIAPVKNFFSSLWNTISSAASTCWNAIKNIWTTVSNWFNTKIIQPVKNFFSGMWDGLKNGASNAWNGIKSIFSTVANFFGDIFKKAWEKVKNVFSVGGKIFDGIKDGIVNVFKSIVNGIIKGINKIVALPFKGLNGILDTISEISILGVEPFSWLTWRLPVPQIPLLAKGAVLPPNDPFLAVVGDQKHGTNIEAPLSTIQEAVANVIKSFAYTIIDLQRAALKVMIDTNNDLGYISHNGFAKSFNAFDNKREQNKENEPGSGDTFIFNSPKPIDEVEAAKQMKKAKRDLAEGF